ncbi:hypothetical protein [Methylomonas sp. UP202]|uniref:hypothetical protein n=1 Tax=unclassified Methylomonas TaxID=2608980 RepID=UPI00247878C4|nr:hypothetical protein [Methylomonas sp. UP202]WGS88604.1 hypothetical protein QC632_24990 [Methylomonas sp. UP202]
MIEHAGKVRLTQAEFRRLQRHNAQRGYAVNTIKTTAEYDVALVQACAPAFLADLLQALETGTSPLVRGEVTYEQLLKD